MARHYAKIVGVLIGAFFITQFLNRALFLNASPRLNPQFLAQLSSNVKGFLAAPLDTTGGTNTGAENEVAECPDTTGNETYTGVLRTGPHIAANINPVNYKQIRRLYNCENTQADFVKNTYIPTTVTYDLLFLKGNVEGIKANLAEMKKYGLLPIIRVSSYTDNSGTWIKIGNEDAKIMGQHLAQALNSMDFPVTPPVTYLNEVNLHIEWGGQSNPAEVAASFASFVDGMGQGKFRIFFPSLSYGATPTIGISPPDFVTQFFASQNFAGRKISGAALNIYGPNYGSIQTQFTSQMNPFRQYPEFFSNPIEAFIEEIGPTDSVSIIYNCSQEGPWPDVSKDVLAGFNTNPVALFATTMCIEQAKTLLVVIHYDGSEPLILPLEQYGGVGNDGPTATATPPPGATNTPVPTNQPQPTNPPGTNPTATPRPDNPPTGQSGTVKIVLHTDTTDGPVWSDGDKNVQVYLEGPTAKGRFGEAMRIYGEDRDSCTSRGGFPYTCTIGAAEWKGADGTSGTATGDYSAWILNVPEGWQVVDDAGSATGVLNANETLTLDLAIRQE